MKAPRRFQYKPRDPNVVKTRATQRGSDFDSIFKEGLKIFKPKEGKNTIRILPPGWEGADHYGYDAYINYGIGINDQAYLSLSEMRKEADPLHEARRKAERAGDKELADSLRPTKRVMMFLIDRTAEDEGPQLWPAPWTVDKAFCSLSIDDESGAALPVDDPDEGHDIRFYKEGTGRTTKYPAERMRILKPSKLSENERLAEEWLEQIAENSIPECLNFYDYDHIAAAFDGHVRESDKPNKGGKTASQDDDEDADSYKTTKTTTTATKKPKGRAEPELGPNEELDEETGEITTKDPPFDEDDDAAVKNNIAKLRSRLASRRG
jgi:hypothetical protein